jgi:hypothetical protein
LYEIYVRLVTDSNVCLEGCRLQIHEL